MYMKQNTLKKILYSTIFICVIVYFVWFKYANVKEGFLDTNYEKTVYLLWQNKKKKTQHGFGDSLRGAISIYQYCKEHKVNLKIDATDDVCSLFLKNVVIDNYDLIKDKNILTFINEDKLYDKLNSELSKSNSIYIYSNTSPIKNLDDDDIEFAKYICEPSDLLKNTIQIKIKSLPFNYGIKHFRFHDDIFKKDFDENDPVFKKSFELLKSDYKENDVLISNSINFIKYSKEKINIKTIPCDNNLCKVEHIGASTDTNLIKNSFVDFFISCNAKYIKSHTVYEWPSNFVSWSSTIYNIPFENIFIN